MTATITVSLVIPAYNEETRVGATLEEAAAYLRKLTSNFEIIVVDDGSTDGTARRVRAALLEIPELNLIESQPNRGKGFAVRRGMLHARGAFRIFMDADHSFSAETIGKVFAALSDGGCEVAVGSRHAPGAQIIKPQPLLRHVAGNAYSLLVNLVCGLGLVDTQCGMKGFTERAAQELFLRTTLNGFGFDVEVLYLARKLKFAIQPVPVQVAHVEGSKVQLICASLGMAADLFRIRRNDWCGRYREPNPDALELMHR